MAETAQTTSTSPNGAFVRASRRDVCLTGQGSEGENKSDHAKPVAPTTTTTDTNTTPPVVAKPNNRWNPIPGPTIETEKAGTHFAHFTLSKDGLQHALKFGHKIQLWGSARCCLQ